MAGVRSTLIVTPPRGSERNMGDYLEEHNDPLTGQLWPIEFDNKEHPLNPPESERRDEELQFIHNRFVALYHEAVTEGRIHSKRDFATMCGAGVNKGGEWLSDAEAMARMDASQVNAACDTFGVSLEYLQGQTGARGMTSTIWTADAVADCYEMLDDDQKAIITSMMRQFNKQRYYNDRMREYAPYAMEATLI